MLGWGKMVSKAVVADFFSFQLSGGVMVKMHRPRI